MSLFLIVLLSRELHVCFDGSFEFAHCRLSKRVLIYLFVFAEALQDMLLHVSVQLVNLIVLAEAVLATVTLSRFDLLVHVGVEFLACPHLSVVLHCWISDAAHATAVVHFRDPV